jgi:hypothetical protein
MLEIYERRWEKPMDKKMIDEILRDIGLEHIEDYYEDEE